MIFSIEEINNDPALLPNISLGYRILNSCASPTNVVRAALTLASGLEVSSTSPCPPAVSAIIAESGSSQSMAVAGTLGPFDLPVVRQIIQKLYVLSQNVSEFYYFVQNSFDICFYR